MREILFRGKTSGGEWVEGSLILAENYCCVLQNEEKVHPMDCPYLDNDLGTIDGKATPVIPETVGQYTGLILNGTKVFEGDIVKREYILYHSEKKRTRETQIGVVSYSNRHCNFEIKGKCYLGKPFGGDTIEVIGNIHDNPELLKDGTDNG